MGSVIKEAFKEGRETKTPWSKSKAREVDIRTEAYLNNINKQSLRESNSTICLEQIDPESGETVNMFTSRIDAARWIVKNVLKREDKNPLSITGNMEICMRLGYKSYGYYWKIVSQKEVLEWNSGKKKGSKSNSKPVFCKYRGFGKTVVFPSIAKAAKILGVSADSLADKLKGGMVAKVKTARLQYYYKNPKVVKFNTNSEAFRFLKVKGKRTGCFDNPNYWPNMKICIINKNRKAH